ncbi:MAG: 4Fe-4S binding protein [bacterium]
MAEFSRLSEGKGDLNKKIGGFLKSLLEKEVVDAALVPARQPENGVMPTLISEPAGCDAVDPFAPVVPVNSAKLVSNLTGVPSGRPAAVVMRSCETRALLELAKLKQANLDDLFLIGMDCVGRFENKDFLEFSRQGGATESYLDFALNGKGDGKDMPELASACKICEYPVPDNVDIRLCVIGSGPADVYVEWVSDKGKEVREKLGMETSEAPSGREEAVKKLVTERTEKRDQVLDEYEEKVSDLRELEEHLAGCVNCYNCRVACPVCYCKECVFVTDTFRHPGDKYMSWADKHGFFKVPSDTLLFHMTRMLHMSAMCVGCGQCSSACPNGIQLAELFRSVARKTQSRFEYLPGRSLDEPQPLSVFYENEFTDVTGQGQ